MRWADERYVRVYTRDTPDWLALSFDAQALFALLLRKVDRSGALPLGGLGKKAVAVVLNQVALWDKRIEPALKELLRDGCLFIKGHQLVIRNYVAAQEAAASPKARKAAWLERQKTINTTAPKETKRSHKVTEWNDAERKGTPSLAVPSLAEPSRADLDRERGGDHEASRRVAESPSPLPSSSRSPLKIQVLGVHQLEDEWPNATLAQLQAVAKKVYEPHKKPAAWLKFLRAAAPFDEAVRVAAARKYLERDAKSGKNLDYLAAIIRSMAKERVAGENGADERRGEDQDQRLTVAATNARLERQKREADELLKLSPEERRAMMNRGLQAGSSLPNGHGNGLHDGDGAPRAPAGHKA